MATLGLFSPELVPKAWFDPELYPLAWFDRTLVGGAAPVPFSDASVPVQVLIGAEVASFSLVDDASVPVSAFVGVETVFFDVSDSSVSVDAHVGVDETEPVFFDSGVPVEVFVGQESTVFVVFDDASATVEAFVGSEFVTSTFYDVGVPVEAFVGQESSVFVLFDDVSVPINAFVGQETIAASFNDVSVPINAFVGQDSAAFTFFDDVSVPINAFVGQDSAAFAFFDDVSVPINAFVGEEALEPTFEDESVGVLAVAPPETVSAGPTPPGPSPSSVPILAGGTPLEDYEVGGYTLRELREVRQALEEGGSLLEEIVELPVREESPDEKKERESGEPRFSDFLKRIIEEPVKPKPEKQKVNWLPAVAIGAFLLGAWLATSGESEAFAGEEPDDDLPDGPPEDESDLGDLEGDDLFFDEPLPLQGPEHAGLELPELVDSIEFRGEELPAGEEIPLENLSPEVADEELLRSIRQEAEEEAVKPKAPRKRRTAKARALTSEPETVLAYRPGRGRA